jgi:DNA-directed RNA polymerase specialized sigma24 family protein
MSESSSQPTPRSDAELIAAAASGDAASYVTLQERHTPAARTLARQVAASPDEAEEVLSDTFTRLHDVLRRGDGPLVSLRPYLLSAVRRVALERSSGEHPDQPGHAEQTAPAAGQTAPAAGQADVPHPNLGEPLFTDPAVAELEGTLLARAYAALPERLRAAGWLTMVECTEPAEAATILGLTEAGIAELPVQVRAALSQAYLKLYLSGLTREACKAEAGQLGAHLARATRGLDERTVQLHLRSCRECRAVVTELIGLDRALPRTLAPIFLGGAAAAYLSAVGAKALPTGPAVGGLAWILGVPGWVLEAPSRVRQASRQQRVMAGGLALLAAFAIAGVSLTLAANTTPQHRADRPFAAVVSPPSPSVTVPSWSEAPAPTKRARAKRASAAPPARSARPAPTRSPSPARSSPTPTPPVATSPAPTPSPTPVTIVPPFHHHHHHAPPGV